MAQADVSINITLSYITLQLILFTGV